MIIVTGGAGFIGSVLVKELNKMGHRDLCLVDRLHSGDKWKNLRNVVFEDFIHADAFNPEMFEDAKIEAIFHMGACSSTTETDADYLMMNNVDCSKNMWFLAQEVDCPLIYASSAATYGAGEYGYSDHHAKVSDFVPLNPYGYSKQCFDQWVLAQKETPKKWFGIKFFNVYGPNEYHKGSMRSLVHKAFGQIAQEGKVRLFKSHRPDFKDGEQLRDFVYVEDVVKGMIRLWKEAKSGDSGLYNMGTGRARSFIDFVSPVFRALEKTSNIEFIPMPEEIRDQYQYYTEAEMQKFSRLFPDFKFLPVEEGVYRYAKDFLLHSNPYYR